MSIYTRHATALQLAADMASELAERDALIAELHADRKVLIERCQITTVERDATYQSLLATQAEVERLTKELDAARQGWADSLKWQSPTNSHIAGNGRIVGDK
jgi:hypothetical protein